jgi:hypothetical protein
LFVPSFPLFFLLLVCFFFPLFPSPAEFVRFIYLYGRPTATDTFTSNFLFQFGASKETSQHQSESIIGLKLFADELWVLLADRLLRYTLAEEHQHTSQPKKE